MRPEGKKYFSITKAVPKELASPHVKEMNTAFEKVCLDIFKSAHRTKVIIRENSKSIKYTFSISFGSHQADSDTLYLVIEKLVNASIWTIMDKVLQRKIESALSSASSHYNNIYKPKQHISVKPNQHIKLC